MLANNLGTTDKKTARQTLVNSDQEYINKLCLHLLKLRKLIYEKFKRRKGLNNYKRSVL